jgi:hypothetical protein
MPAAVAAAPHEAAYTLTWAKKKKGLFLFEIKM